MLKSAFLHGGFHYIGNGRSDYGIYRQRSPGNFQDISQGADMAGQKNISPRMLAIYVIADLPTVTGEPRLYRGFLTLPETTINQMMVVDYIQERDAGFPGWATERLRALVMQHGVADIPFVSDISSVLIADVLV
jgi:hypothetical protein